MYEFIVTNPVVRIAVLVLIFVVVMAAVFAAATLIAHRMALREQLERLKGHEGIIENPTSLRSRHAEGAWSRIAAAVEAAGLDLTDTKDERLSAKLRAAGYMSPSAPRVFTLVRLLGVIALPVGYIALAFSGPRPPSFMTAYIVGALLALLGLYIPNLFVAARADRRREEITRGFPDCLDLLIVCVESGLGIEAGLDRVGRELALSHPLIAQLISVTTLQLRAGASREDAFRKLADAAGVDEVRSFTTLLIQSDKLGTSITQTLRVYAAEMREMRRLRAEEKAHRLPVMISIPLVVCMLPVMIGVLMLPAVVRMMKSVFPMMMGG